MYCVRCGVKLADSEKKCPLCGTEVCHPDFVNRTEEKLYPSGKLPPSSSGSKVLNGAVIILFLIPLLVCFLADITIDGKMEWFGYVAGAIVLAYVIVALPMWFKKPNPVIFVPCDFVAAGLYLLYINLAAGGNWFLKFAFPVVGGIGLITCSLVTLMYYLKRGRLYMVGGAFIATGAFMLLVEFLMNLTFDLSFIGWSLYPLVVLVLFGCLIIYLAINSDARETLERKLFF